MAEDPRLFDPGPKQRPDRNYDPNEWSQAPDVVWHSSQSKTPPKPVSGEGERLPAAGHAFFGFHTGTLRAATERAEDVVGEGESRENIYPYALGGQFSLPTKTRTVKAEYTKWDWKSKTGAGKAMGGKYPNTWTDSGQDTPAAQRVADKGMNVPYVNEAEHKGSVSFMTNRPENLKTWSESTLSDPQAPRHLRALAEHYELVGKRTDSRPIQSWQQESLPGVGTWHVQRGQIESGHPEGTVGVQPYESSHEEFGEVANVLKRKND